jgi:hypothetical protein
VPRGTSLHGQVLKRAPCAGAHIQHAWRAPRRCDRGGKAAETRRDCLQSRLNHGTRPAEARATVLRVLRRGQARSRSPAASSVRIGKFSAPRAGGSRHGLGRRGRGRRGSRAVHGVAIVCVRVTPPMGTHDHVHQIGALVGAGRLATCGRNGSGTRAACLLTEPCRHDLPGR